MTVTADFDFAMDVISHGDFARLEELAQMLEGFPDGVDGFVNQRWISHAIQDGCVTAAIWMIGKKIDLDFREGDGSTALVSAIELGGENGLMLLKVLIAAGADLNIKGYNDWTPLHAAVYRNNKDAIRILLKAGADRTIRTEMDERLTPEEEARILGLTNLLDVFVEACP